MDYTRKFTEKLSVEQAKIELLNIAYGNGDTFFCEIGSPYVIPMVLLFWHCSMVYSSGIYFDRHACLYGHYNIYSKS